MQSKSPKPKFIPQVISHLPAETEATGKWKYEETRDFWNLKNSETYCRIHKRLIEPADYPVTLKILRDEVENIAKHSPELNPEIAVLEMDEKVEITPCGPGISAPSHFVIRIKRLQDQYRVRNQIAKERFDEDKLPLFIEFFKNYNAEANRPKERGFANFEKIKNRFDNLFYQSGKYNNLTVTKSMLDLVRNPLYKFLGNQEKSFQARVKNKQIVRSLGYFDLERVFLHKGRVLFSPEIDLSVQDLFKDSLEDLASFQLELCFLNRGDLANEFIKNYLGRSGGPLALKLNEVFKILKAMERGLEFTVRGKSGDNEEYLERAGSYYRLMVQFVRELSEPERAPHPAGTQTASQTEK